jgi:hypothetical protein
VRGTAAGGELLKLFLEVAEERVRHRLRQNGKQQPLR